MLKIVFGSDQRCFGRGERGSRGFRGSFGGVKHIAARGLLFVERLLTLIVAFGVERFGLSLHDGRFGRLERGLILHIVETVEHIALFDERAVGKSNLFYFTGHSGSDVHRMEGSHAACQSAADGLRQHFYGLDGHHREFGVWRWGSLDGAEEAGGKACRRECRKRHKADRRAFHENFVFPNQYSA